MRLEKFFENLQQDLKLFCFLLLLICVYRAWFLWYMSGSYMGSGTEAAEVGTALWTGLRLSLKSAGGMALSALLLATLPNLAALSWPAGRIRLWLGTAAAFLLSVLFQARFPYYHEFQMTFHLQVVQGIHDDVGALFWTFLQEYGLIWRFALAVLLTAACWLALRRILATGTLRLPPLSSGWSKALCSFLLVLGLGLFFLFVRFGGSFTYAQGINWENAGVTSDAFLNECILDDVQALYRARAMEKRMRAGKIDGVYKDRIREYAKGIAGHEELESGNLGDYLERRAKGAKLPKPRHIFIILGETWMQWPLLEQYADLHVADGLKGIIAEPNACYVRAFMPNGDFTSIAITGLVTGLSEVNIRANYQPRTYEEIYPAAMAEQFRGLGYAVDFWYGGMPSWDSIERMALAQGFDHFYGCPDFRAPKQTTWGAKDGDLFAALERHLEGEPPTVHLIMTTTNHPPYNLDLAAEGFDLDREIREVAKLPNVEDPEELARELGHYWYMDKVATEFARRVMERHPDSLFVITGDHAVRSNPGTKPTMFEQQSVPFVLYGQGVSHDILPRGTVGGHTSIVPTLVELIAPEGYSYHSIASSMTEPGGAAFNRDFWIAGEVMGEIGSDRTELLPGIADADRAAARALLDRVLPPMRTVSWWLLTHGTALPREGENSTEDR